MQLVAGSNPRDSLIPKTTPIHPNQLKRFLPYGAHLTLILIVVTFKRSLQIGKREACMGRLLLRAASLLCCLCTRNEREEVGIVGRDQCSI